MQGLTGICNTRVTLLCGIPIQAHMEQIINVILMATLTIISLSAKLADSEVVVCVTGAVPLIAFSRTAGICGIPRNCVACVVDNIVISGAVYTPRQ